MRALERISKRCKSSPQCVCYITHYSTRFTKYLSLAIKSLESFNTVDRGEIKKHVYQVSDDATQSKVEQSLGGRISAEVERDSSTEDKTFVMHNASGGISGDFRTANVNRRKKQNRHPPRRRGWQWPPPAFHGRSIASRSKQAMEGSKK